MGDFLHNVHLPLSLSARLSLTYFLSVKPSMKEFVGSPRMCTHQDWLVENLSPDTLLTSTSWFLFFFILP